MLSWKESMVGIDKINLQRLQSLHELHKHSMSILTYNMQIGNLHLQPQQKNPTKKKNHKTSLKPWNNIRSKQHCPDLQNSFENIWNMITYYVSMSTCEKCFCLTWRIFFNIFFFFFGPTKCSWWEEDLWLVLMSGAVGVVASVTVALWTPPVAATVFVLLPPLQSLPCWSWEPKLVESRVLHCVSSCVCVLTQGFWT